MKLIIRARKIVGAWSWIIVGARRVEEFVQGGTNNIFLSKTFFLEIRKKRSIFIIFWNKLVHMHF